MAVTPSTALLKPSSTLSAKNDKVLVTHSTCQNVAEDNSFQVNGPVANEVNYYSFDTLIINYSSSSSSRRQTRLVNNTSSSKLASETTGSQHKPKSPKATRDKAPVQIIQTIPDQKAKRRPEMTSEPGGMHDITLASTSSGKKGVVCAIKRAGCQRDYISDRIVKRFGLNSHLDCSADMSAVVAGDFRFVPTRSYVVLVSSSATQNRQGPHHFYIVERCSKFDVLFGSEVISDLSPPA